MFCCQWQYIYVCDQTAKMECSPCATDIYIPLYFVGLCHSIWKTLNKYTLGIEVSWSHLCPNPNGSLCYCHDLGSSQNDESIIDQSIMNTILTSWQEFFPQHSAAASVSPDCRKGQNRYIFISIGMIFTKLWEKKEWSKVAIVGKNNWGNPGLIPSGTGAWCLCD